jgi:hypothetical protein
MVLEFELKGLVLARQVLYHLSQVPSPFLLFFGVLPFARADLRLLSSYLCHLAWLR